MIKVIDRLLLAILTIFIFCKNTNAETDSLSMKEIRLEQAVVSSSKQERSIFNLSTAASSVPYYIITKNRMSDLKDISSFVPNLFMPRYGSALTSPIYIRGIGSKLNTPSVGLYVDGMPFFEKSVSEFNLNEVEKIEFLRGPQGSLYGRNTMGGIINVYTKNPLDYSGTFIKMNSGNYGNYGGSISHYDKINEHFGYVLSTLYRKKGGFFINEFLDKKVDEAKSYAGQVKLEWKKNNTHITFVSNYDNLNEGGYPYQKYKEGVYEPIRYNAESSYKRDLFNNGLNMVFDFQNFSLRSNTSFQYYNDKQNIDQDFSVKDEVFVTQNQSQKLFSQEIELRANKNSRYNWILGLSGFNQEKNNNVISNVKPVVLIDKNTKINTKGFAIYHQSTYDGVFSDRISATFGIRYDMEFVNEDFSQTRTSLKTNKVVATSHNKDIKFHEFSPKISVDYQASNDLFLYSSITQGYKSGGFNISFEKDHPETQTYKPEYSINYEVGAKYSSKDILGATLSLFYIDWKDQHIYQLIKAKTGGSYLSNAGKTVSKGIEFEAWVNPAKRLFIRGSYGYTDAKYVEYTTTDKITKKEISYKGNRLPYVPKHTLSISADYSFPIGGTLIDYINISSIYKGAGDIYWNDENSEKQKYYGTIDINISLAKGDIKLSIFGKNISSTRYDAFKFSFRNENYVQKGIPTHWGAELSISI